MNTTRVLIAPLLLLGVVACGDERAATDATSTAVGGTEVVEVRMSDFEYSPSSLEFQAGTTVEFVFVNDGSVPHDAYVGDEAAQEAHEEEMASMPAGHSHDMGEEGVTVQPGESATLTYTFDEDGTLFIGCHQTGHWDAGMRLPVRVDA